MNRVIAPDNNLMPKTRTTQKNDDQALLFPPDSDFVARELCTPQKESRPAFTPRGTSVVLCGTYRKDPAGLHRVFAQLNDMGFSILSPKSVSIESEENGFVYMENETTQTPDDLEKRHLEAIQSADFVWFFAPNGYVGPTGALEVGFARANGIPVYSDTRVDDIVLHRFIEVVPSPSAVFESFNQHRVLPPPPAVKTFQNYYRRAAIQRGYSHESAKDCLLLMLEEFGELARAIRKRLNLARHGKPINNHEALELADVFIYVVHMANVLNIDLSEVVQAKEMININKLLHGKSGNNPV